MYRVIVRPDGLHLQCAVADGYETLMIFDRPEAALAAFFAEVSTTGDMPTLDLPDSATMSEGEPTPGDLDDDFYAPPEC